MEMRERAMVGVREILAVSEVAADHYSSSYLTSYLTPPIRALDGGQLAGQALNAACATVSQAFEPHSIHAAFIAAGDPSQPVDFFVSRDRDGRSFVTRNVIASQEDRLIFRMAASFCVPEPGVDVQLVPMPDVASAQASPPLRRSLMGFENRDPNSLQEGETPTQTWARPASPLGSDQRWNACALVYLSDMFTGLPHLLPYDETSFMTSLDHAVWFHRPFILDDWILATHHGLTLASGRAWFIGDYFSAEGVHVASSAQEMLYRPPRENI